MKYLIILLSLMLVLPCYAKPCKAVYKADGSVAIIYAVTADGYDQAIAADPELRGRPTEDIDDGDLPSRSERKYWTAKNGGGVKVDNTNKNADKAIKDEKEAKKTSAKNKLKALGLTNEEIEELFN